MITIIIVFGLLIFVGGLYGFISERLEWNNGKCKACNVEWEDKITDSQGGVNYVCPSCNKSIWLSWLTR